MVAYTFNAQQYQPDFGGGGGNLPEGKYKVVISEITQEMTKDGKGGFLAAKLSVIEGPLTGQFQIDRMNVHNTDPTAVRLANERLSAYCFITGKFAIEDLPVLYNIPFGVEIEPQKNNPQYSRVKAIFDVNGNKPTMGGPAPAAPAPAPQPAPAPAPAPAAAAGWGSPGAAATGATPQAEPAPAPAPAANGWGAPAGEAAPAANGWGAPAGEAAPAANGWGR